MRIRPIKVGERRDAARYVLKAVVRDTAGREHDDMSASNARKLLAELNGIGVDAAQYLLDQANEDYEMMREFGKLGQLASRQGLQQEARGNEERDEKDDTVIED